MKNSIAPRAIPSWMRVVPFFMSGLLFLSALFSVFAPLPLALLWVKRRPWTTALALATNSGLVLLAGGGISLLSYWVVAVSVGLALGVSFSRYWKLEIAALAALAAMVVSVLFLVLFSAVVHHVAPWTAFQQEYSAFLEVMRQTVVLSPKELQTSLLNGLSVEEWLGGIAYELPAALGVFALVLVSVNLVILFKMNPDGYRVKVGLGSHALKRWKAPEWLVWPTIVLGFLFLLGKGPTSLYALGGLKIVGAVYVLQGLSILGFFLDFWKIRGFMRTLAIMFAVFLALPLLVSLGFFDLWFDFRAKFRQT